MGWLLEGSGEQGLHDHAGYTMPNNAMLNNAMPERATSPFETEALARIRRRAEAAAGAGEATFALPEAEPVVQRVASMVDGPLREAAEKWLESGASYHALVRLVARAVIDVGGDAPASDAVYVPKASGELGPILRLWPAVLVVPTIEPLTPLDLVELRAFPVHPLGVVCEATWADGRSCGPAEYFFHDLDHARFKLREDLLLEGQELPDAYQDGSTWDQEAGQHRVILGAADGKLAAHLWDRAAPRLALARRLVAFVTALDEPLRAAGELLLFEILVEKSHSLDVAVLARELAYPTHVDKIRHKRASGFFGMQSPGEETMCVLDDVRRLLRGAL